MPYSCYIEVTHVGTWCWHVESRLLHRRTITTNDASITTVMMMMVTMLLLFFLADDAGYADTDGDVDLDEIDLGEVW